MKTIIYIGLGGVLGAICRFGLSEMMSTEQVSFYWSTFTINLLGSFLLGLILALVTGKLLTDENLKSLITTGFISSFTTFSTFSNEMLALLRNELIGLALIYLLASVVLGVLLSWLGLYVGKEIAERVGVGREEGKPNG